MLYTSHLSLVYFVVILLTCVVNFSFAQAQPLPPRAAPNNAYSYEELRSFNNNVQAETMPVGEIDPGWWQPLVAKPLGERGAATHLSLEATLIRTLDHSQQIKVFSELPLIRETAIVEADAAFDWYGFIDSRWDDVSEPIGNTLTAGAGVNRFNDHNLTGSIGARRRTRTGGQLEASQRFGFQDTNSQFFVPSPQGSSRLSLSFTQPLLRGKGKVYNNSLIVLAQLDKCVADVEFRRQLQAHLLEVARSYWALYQERALLYQKINSYMRGKHIFDKLVKRQGIDAPQNQIVSAEASLRQRQAELTRARASVKNAESRLRSLVNDPTLMDLEIIPVDQPCFTLAPAEMSESLAVAFQSRPELEQSVKQLKAACVRLNMSKHELLPVLNLVTETYVNGLAANGNAGQAFTNQFAIGDPSYSVGLQFEVPLHNRAAKARNQRRRLEMRQLQSQYATSLETVRLEVEVAVRELHTSGQEVFTKQRAMQARATQLDALTQRWQRLPGVDVTASLALENLLISQENLARAEAEYLLAQLTYNLSHYNLKRATGTLLDHEQVTIGRGCMCNLPVQIVDKPELQHHENIAVPPTPYSPIVDEVHVAPIAIQDAPR